LRLLIGMLNKVTIFVPISHRQLLFDNTVDI